jgi:hypothetical protein
MFKFSEPPRPADWYTITDILRGEGKMLLLTSATFYKSKRRHIAKDLELQQRHSENLELRKKL